MPTDSQTYGYAHTPRGFDVRFNDWTLTFNEDRTEWSGSIACRNPLLVEEDGMCELQFMNEGKNAIVYQGIAKVTRIDAKAPVMEIVGVGVLDAFPDNMGEWPESLPPGIPQILTAGDLRLVVERTHLTDPAAYRYRLMERE